MPQTAKTVLFLLTLLLCGVALASSPPKPPEVTALDDVPVVTGDWRLPPGHFIPAKMPMHLVYPRPESETATWARHLWAYPGIEYRIPVAVQGGAYPFHFEILSGPPGMTIGQTVWERDYGIASWTPAVGDGAHPVNILVTDQEGNQVTASFNVSVDRNQFIFLDPAAAPGGDGSINSPLRTFDEIHRGSRDDRTFSGRILYLRGGLHQLTGPDDSNGNFRIDSDNKPLVWLGHPGEQVTIDASQSMVVMIGGNSGDDLFVQGLEFANSRPDVSNSRFFFFGGSRGNRTTFFEIDFRNLVRGEAGNDNPGAIVRFAGSGYADYFTVMNSSIENYDAGMVGSIYSTRYAVVEGNTLGDAKREKVLEGIFPKGSNTLWSIRRNDSLVQNFHQGAIDNYMAGGQEPWMTEIAYNRINVPDRRMAFRYNWSKNNPGGDWVWVYRNTFVGDVRGLAGGNGYTAMFENNVMLFGGSGPLPSSSDTRTIIEEGNLTGSSSEASEVLDENLSLIGDYRDELLGKVGYEIKP